MPEEKSEYTVSGYIAFFKHEADGDYHVVLTDDTNQYAQGKEPGTGHSVVVEIPDPGCFPGHSGAGSSSSRFGQDITEARDAFEQATQNVDGAAIPAKSIPVTVTGVAFFDFYHGQTGHAVVQTTPDGRRDVVELHPVTRIDFTNATETD